MKTLARTMIYDPKPIRDFLTISDNVKITFYPDEKVVFETLAESKVYYARLTVANPLQHDIPEEKSIIVETKPLLRLLRNLAKDMVLELALLESQTLLAVLDGVSKFKLFVPEVYGTEIYKPEIQEELPFQAIVKSDILAKALAYVASLSDYTRIYRGETVLIVEGESNEGSSKPIVHIEPETMNEEHIDVVIYEKIHTVVKKLSKLSDTCEITGGQDKPLRIRYADTAELIISPGQR